MKDGMTQNAVAVAHPFEVPRKTTPLHHKPWLASPDGSCVS